LQEKRWTGLLLLTAGKPLHQVGQLLLMRQEPETYYRYEGHAFEHV
jgi:hypothetical protein